MIKMTKCFKTACFALGVALTAFMVSSPVIASGEISKAVAESMAATATSYIPVIIQMKDRVNPRVFASIAPAGSDIDPEVQKQNRKAMLVSMRKKSTVAQKDVVDFLEDNGVTHIQKLWINNSLVAMVPSDLIAEISEFDNVDEIRLNKTFKRHVTPVEKLDIVRMGTNISKMAINENISLVNAPGLWDLGIDGEGITVAIVDSGVDVNHADLVDRYRGGTNSWYNPYADYCDQFEDAFGYECTECDANGDTPCDDPDNDGISHGTGVAGNILGGNASGYSIGTAPGAKWIAGRVFTQAGDGTYGAFHAVLQWLLDPDNDPETDDAPDIVNNSWGSSEAGYYEPEFREDIQALVSAGIIVVVSAGNSGPEAGTDTSPANYPESLSVGSVGNDLSDIMVSSFSSRGPNSYNGALFPNVVAPGYRIMTSYSTDGGAEPYLYITMSGTSFAAPQTTGVMALLRQAFPNTPISELIEAIKATATDLGNSGADNIYGNGLINATAAYDWLSRLPNIAISGENCSAENNYAVDFGNVGTESNNQKLITIANTGRGELDLEEIALANEDYFAITDDDCTGSALNAEETCQFVISFAAEYNDDYGTILTIKSNDIDQSTVSMSVLSTLTGGIDLVPEILIGDSTGNENDQTLSFDSHEYDEEQKEVVSITNTGAGDLVIPSVEYDGSEYFTIYNDACSGTTLTQNETCEIVITFAPKSYGLVRGTLTINSNDEDESVATVEMAGIGNALPVVAELMTPASGEVIPYGTVIEFQWRQADDSDGEETFNHVVISTSPDFSDEISSVAIYAGAATTSMAFGFLLFGAGAISNGRISKKNLIMSILMASLVFALTACGGGGSSSGQVKDSTSGDIEDDTVTDPFLRSYTGTSMLEPGTYYWKVLSTDEIGSEVESSVGSFVVQ